MTTSGSVNFDQSASEVIKDALILVGGLEDDETPSANQEQYALRMLNRLCKAWSAKGLKIWAWQEAELLLIIGQQSYTIGAGGDLVINRPIRIDNARRVVSSVETPIDIVSRQEYMNQPQKDSSGKVNFVYYDSQLTQGVMYVWPAPDAADSIKFSYRSYIEDFDTVANTAHFPAEWLDALVYNLALRLMPMYEVTGEDRVWITNMAGQFLADAEAGDMDESSVFITAERRL